MNYNSRYQTIIIIHILICDSLEPNEGIKFTLDYKQMNQYLGVFKDLSTNNNGLVAYDKLQERLISTGKLDAGESVLTIEHMQKTG
jgi:5-hydroxyisourate hydrolase-like protein (transthyretin family)